MYWSKAIKKSKLLEVLTGNIFTYIIYLIRAIGNHKKISNDFIVIIALRKLGDAVFTIPAIRQVQGVHKGKMLLICFPETEPIYRAALNDIDIQVLNHNSFYLNDRFAKLSARRMIAKLQPGTIIDLTGVITSATLILTSNAEHIIGTNEKYFHSVYSEYVNVPGNVHMVHHYLYIVKKHFSFPDGKGSEEFSIKIKQDGYILIHPFAGWAAKEWNLPKFISLANQIGYNYNCLMVVPAGYAKKMKINEISKSGIEIIETKDIAEMISVIKECSLFISNDSGPLQIAALLGKPTFTIYGPTNPYFHLPFGKNHKYIQKTIECSPKKGEKFCFTNAGRDGCPSFECMNLLSVKDVSPQVMEFIDSLKIESKVRQVLNS
jgi:ADP-heptose:LPS heptosyltransferase